MRSGLPEINIATRIDFARTNKWQTNFPADKQHAKEKTGIHLIDIPVFLKLNPIFGKNLLNLIDHLKVIIQPHKQGRFAGLDLAILPDSSRRPGF
jgi:hypothetical protein